eukprot:CAMPEP_0179074610 /NCGR_PEP_ID=MMETSP0796-20121207/33173_1 /TAXON_ID=73915 /ORGANISM="Pyrodinium bahamense, Strain pbaha01" /LENGTH=243 /DNA_ID=CAMNT_0020771835 /DNA_START=150 /DNA_END=881 /DNA_ORIENTATION=+
MKLSLSQSCMIFSIVWPVQSARCWFKISRMKRISRAWMRTSAACPCAPPNGWWIIIREFGRLLRLPFVPAASRKDPMDAANPKQTVLTSHGMNCIVSKMAMPAETDPPGELMYIVMSSSSDSLARYSICAMSTCAISSLTSPPRMMMRSWSSFDITSILPPSPVSTMGICTGGTWLGGSLRRGSISGSGPSGAAARRQRGLAPPAAVQPMRPGAVRGPHRAWFARPRRTQPRRRAAVAWARGP